MPRPDHLEIPRTQYQVLVSLVGWADRVVNPEVGGLEPEWYQNRLRETLAKLTEWSEWEHLRKDR
jgi:hypothetical protein